MSHISTLRLHQLRLGELAPAVASAVESHLATCELCAARLGHQRQERFAFQHEPIPAGLVPAPSVWDRLRRWWGAAALVPALAAAGLVFALPSPADPTVETTRTKGAHAGFEAWVQTGGSVRPLYTGERVRPGTRLQLKYDPGDHAFVTLAGRDGTGAVEIYGTVPADGPGLATAPFALTLDAAPGSQAFYAVMTDRRPDPSALDQALRRDPVRLDGAEVRSVVLQKE